MLALRPSAIFGRHLIALLATAALAMSIAPRSEVAVVVGVWMICCLPGAWVIDRMLPASHPLAWAPAMPAAATVVGLAPLAAAAWICTLLHARLPEVLALYLGLVAGLVAACARVQPRSDDAPPTVCTDTSIPPRAGAALVAFATIVGGLAAMGTIKATRAFETFRNRWYEGEELGPVPSSWLWGLAIALGGSLWLGASLRGSVARESSKRTWAHALAWVAAIAIASWAARIAFALPPRTERWHRAWDLDDVVYVAEAVDALAGLPLGLYEPTLGLELGRVRSSTSVFGAPMAALTSWATGVGPAELHHGVLPPLLVLLFASALAAALRTVLGRRPLAIGVGLASSMLMMLGTWDYPANIGQYLVLQAAQPKTIQLGLLAPLQLATIARLGASADRRDLAIAVIVGGFAHAVHPFATILACVWIACALVVAAVRRRADAVRALLTLASFHALAGLETWWTSRHATLPAVEIHDRTLGEIRESRDLLRSAEGGARAVLDPRLLFGADTLTALGVLSVPAALALGRRRSEAAFAGLCAIVGLAICLVEPVGTPVMRALHPAIFWRARWFVPSLVLVGVLAATVLDASLWLARGRRGWTAFATALVVLAHVSLPRLTHGRWLHPGRSPVALDKLDRRTRALSEWLGPGSCATVLLAPDLAAELPQLQPHVRLLQSRTKAMRPPRAGSVEELRRILRAFAARELEVADLRRLVSSYSIDVVVLDPRDRESPPKLEALGWAPNHDVHHLVIWTPPNGIAEDCLGRREGTPLAIAAL